jgi:hypothetical protein
MQMAAKRGYDDIDPEFAWENWQAVRHTLPENQEPPGGPRKLEL